MNQPINTIAVVLLIILCTVTIVNIFYQNNQIKEAIDQLALAEQNIVNAIIENEHSNELVNKLQFEIQRTNDSLDILIAERDSIILSYKRWGSDKRYIKYNQELKSKAGMLKILRKNYNELIATKNTARP